MYQICTAQASLREYKRQLKKNKVPNDKRFDMYLKYYMTEAIKRRDLSIELHNHELHNHSAAPLESIVSRHDIAAIKICMLEQNVERKEKKIRSDCRIVKLKSKILQLQATQGKMPAPEIWNIDIQKCKTKIEEEQTYQEELVEHANRTDAHLEFMEAENNGLGDSWIQANPLMFQKIWNLNPSNF